MDMKNIEDFYPLSPMQQGMLFHSLYAPESGVYVEQVSCTLRGNIDVAAFEQAWQCVVNRHAILRTAFIGEGLKEPVQVVQRQVTVRLEQNDWRDLAEATQQAELASLLQAEKQRGLTLSEPPLLRLILIRSTEDAYHFVWIFHHLLLDGWSVPLLFGEVLAFYEASLHDHDLQLEPVPAYKEYIVWLKRQNLAAAEAFWRRTLAGFVAPTPLGVDRLSIDAEASSHASTNADRYTKRQALLSARLTEGLRELARQHKLTLNTLVQGIWALLLSRYSGETDIVFGSTVSGRPGDLAGVERMIGLFINTLPIRVAVSPDALLLPWLTDLQNHQAEIRQYEYTPLVQVQGWSDVPRDLPLFESILVFENYPTDNPLLESRNGNSSLDIQNVTFVEQTNYPLTVVIGPGHELMIALFYDSQRFEPDTIDRMFGHLQTMLASIVANPDQRLDTIPLLTSAERQQLLVEWNATAVPYPHDQCIHQLVEQQVERTPDAIALVFADQHLTYRELNQRANQIAHYLRRLHVRPGELVGIAMDRSADLILGLLGILKTGAAYVPLDPSYPAERLAFMIKDTGTPVVITQASLQERLPQEDTRLICLDSEWPAIACEADTNLACAVTATHPAYVMYTSGSTGQPKGVIVAHRAINRLVCNTNYIAITPDDRIAQASTTAFDAATFEIWGAFVHGAQLVGVAREVLLSPEWFATELREKGITTLFVTTALLNQVAREAPGAFGPLRYLLFGGEAVDPRQVREILAHDPPDHLLHVYGPTETTTFATWHPVYAVAPGARTIPIGGPLSNTELYVLDPQRQPVPIGVPGELYIGGPGVAQGYLNRPELTAEKFIAHPFAGPVTTPGETTLSPTLYRTGDLVRYLPDGSIEFLGRIDTQVKIRGFRIELGEIEAVLSQHPAIQAAVVLAREDIPGDKRLAAYIVPAKADRTLEAGTEATLKAAILDFIQTRLPAYMIPSAIVFLNTFPLNLNGKIDRRALPAPEVTDFQQKNAYVAPRTPTEEVLAGIYAQVLGIKQAGAFDNFFELGGHSLLATQLTSRVRTTFHLDLPLRILFEHPVLADLAAQIELAQRTAGGLEAPPIEAVPRNNNFPLSFAQQRLWFLAQLEPDSPFYNMPAALRFRGALNVPALEQSLARLVQRHEVLRTTFVTVDGQPVQVIAPAGQISLPVDDLRHLSPDEREAAAYQMALAEARQPFDLACGPLLRVRLLHLDADDYLALFTMHHIITDGWSIDVLLREIASFYTAAITGVPATLPDLPIQYADFAVWQRQWLQGDVLEQHMAYWRQQLQGAPPLLELPTDRPRPAVQTSYGTTYSFDLPATLTDGLRRLSQQNGCTLFMALLAAFQVLLSRYSRQTDICVGTPIANRTRAELEPLIGFFVNTLVLRTDLSANPSFRALLQQVREVTLGAYAHQDIPFEMLVEALQPTRSLSHSPLFQVMFVLQNMPITTQNLPDLTLETVPVESGTTNFDLSLILEDRPGALEGQIEYNTDLFDAATIVRMVEHFEILLAGIVANPDQPIVSLPLLTEAGRQQVVETWNATTTPFPHDQCIHHLIERQVERTPQAVAVIAQGQQVCYDELNARANQLAHYLQKAGVGPDVLVGICLERSPDLIVALLAILKAGAAYVPLDPAVPARRLAFTMQDAQVRVLVTRQHLLETRPELATLLLLGSSQAREQAAPSPAIVAIDAEAQSIAQESPANPTSSTTPDHLAYVIYTSGSTGQPKGVAVHHRAVVNHNVAVSDLFDLTPQDRVLQFATLAFDAAVEEIFPTLQRGATLVLRPGDTLPSATELHHLIEAEQLTVLDLPTAYWHEWVADLERNPTSLPASLRLVILGGEAVVAERLRAWQQVAGPGIRCLNTYGPTEATVIATAYEPPADTPWTQAVVPIGRPIANMRIYLLDAEQNPVPVGVPGELYIGGVGVARGYINRPEATAAHFIADPFNSQGGARLYKTGDLARYQPDGTIEFLGRTDYQVKVRGFRVEPGEIETVLREHPSLRDSIVLLREDPSGNQRLVAYVVPAEADLPEPDELRSYMKQRLPDYMLPSVFVRLDALPLTPNGKVDRQALPVPADTQTELESGFAAPQTPVEQILAGLWAQVLGTNQVGMHANFFSLGGHSLLATQLVSRLRQTFDVELPLRTIFEAPTVAELALHIETARRAGAVLAPPITPVARDGDLPVSFGQQRLWFIAQLEPDNPFYNMPTALRFRGRLDIPALAGSIWQLVQRHEVLRTTFVTVDGQPVQVIADPGALPLPIADLRHLPPAEREATARQLALAEAQQPFDLSRGPLLRVQLLHLDTDDYLALFTMHHIISDGWSIDILLREIAALYAAALAGETAPLPDLPIQYADFAVWQRQWLQGDVLEQHMAYWRQQLQGAPPLLELPTDRPRPAVQTSNGATYRLSLPEALADALRHLSQQNGCTLFMTLLAAFQVLLSRYSRQTDICVGTPIANRTRAELEPLIGFFVNTLVLRTDLSANPSVRALLQQVREVTLGAYAHQDIPFEMLVEALQPTRSLSHSPLFQVMFTLETSMPAAQSLPDLSLEPVTVEGGTAKFDLTLSLIDEPGALEGQIEYNTDLFDATTIARMAGHFATLLAGIVADPDQSIASLPVLTNAERQQVLIEWNDTTVPYPDNQCIHHLVERQVEQMPDAIAVVFADQTLTYGELNQRANQIAHALQRLGVGQGAFVGIAMERSADFIVGLLGILKAGAAYVPLDPSYPAERLAFMLADTRTPVVLTQAALLEQLPHEHTTLLCVDTEWQTIAQESGDNPTSTAMAEHPAYVMYTSGSTGQPKGVVVPHRAINRLVCNTNYIEITPDDRIAQASTTAFDAATFEIWGALVHGARLIGITHEVLLSPQRFARAMHDQRISIMFLTTALFNQLAHEQPEAFSPLRYLLFGGEAADARRVHEVLAHTPPDHVINVYGPTETTTFATWYHVETIPDGAGTIPIGRPIANTRLYVLDPQGQPVPIGVPGELYIGGAGVARGYLNRPELTAEKFIADPFSADPDARLYRTGDLVRYVPDGTIEFLGRIDTQVKIRGFRIELGEIEAVLGQHTAVQDVVVLAREDIPGDKRLVAYIVPSTDQSIASGELKTWLQDKLPAYMLPAAFVLLEELPLNPNGKVDRRALPAPDADNTRRATEYVPPRNPIEQLLTELGAGILGIDQVGVHDNFFELGGHSLLATQFISRISDAFQVHIPLRTLFETPTIAALALAIAQYSVEQQIDEEIDGLLDELEQLSEDAVQALLAQQTPEQ